MGYIRPERHVPKHRVVTVVAVWQHVVLIMVTAPVKAWDGHIHPSVVDRRQKPRRRGEGCERVAVHADCRGHDGDGEQVKVLPDQVLNLPSSRHERVSQARQPGIHACHKFSNEILKGWPKLWANFKALIGNFSKSVGPSLAIWANPVQFSFVPQRRG